MGKTPAEILELAAGFEEFRAEIVALKGCFPLESEDMLKLGQLYFLRYPDSSSNRNMENISIGYRIVRTCIVEKILEGIDERYRVTVRGMLDDFKLIDAGLEKLEREIGIEEIEGIVYVIERNLDRVRGVIDELPRGMVKERFVGGISKFYNEMYLMNEAIKKMKGRGEGGR